MILNTTSSRACVTAVALTTMLVGGCAPVGPNYKRPELAPPSTYRGAPAASGVESIADMPWWQVFQDAELQGLLREAVVNSPDLRLAVARVQEARATAGVVRSYLYPDISLSAGYTGNQASRNSQPPGATRDGDRTYNNTSVAANLSWEADLFGRLRRNNEAAFARYLATEEGRRAVLVTLVSDVASSYFLLQELDLQLETARRTLSLNDQTVQYYTDRLNGGVSNRLELDQAKANRALTAAAIPDLERQIAVVEHAVSVLVGRAPGAIGRGPTLADRQGPPVVPVGVPASLLERRPDVMQAERQLVAANADIGAARALFYPTISLTGALGTVSGDLGDFLKGDSLIWSVGAGLFQPLFNAGRNKRNLEAAEARFEQAMVIYQRSALNAYREVADALVTSQKLAEVRTQQETGVAALRDAAELSRLRYEQGLSTYLEVLYADQELFRQEIQLARTRGGQLRVLVQLYRALGGGWQQPAATSPAPAAVP
ncbi:RND transporter [Luteitalea sp. TBR-22]|uniref:efflux transporter outer membrane subunit n=1 Tax=Luteitalea sp. TBR-22 TaxID=2802971 RepID=UPI001AF2436C|nr:efflux transporter outer membrane subunit [Luteitalea sp. TBR-22]BCS34950.1 RND transporter [Luteitalea sp. TBR-22]